MRMRLLGAMLSALALAACGPGGGSDRLGQPAASPSPYATADLYAVSNAVAAEDAAGRARTDEAIADCLAAPGVSSRREEGPPARHVVSLTEAATAVFEECISAEKGIALTPYAPYDGGLEPGQQVALHHCGVVNVDHEGQEWEVEDDPFDATNAPDTFSGFGSFQRQGEALLFRDVQGATLTFTLWDGTPDPYTCG